MAFGKLSSKQITEFNTPTVCYTAPSGGAVIGIAISNIQGVPLYYNLSIGTANPAAPADYLAVKKIAVPNIAATSAPYILEKIPLSAGEIVIVTLIEPEDAHDYYDINNFGINVRIFGADGSDLTTARYSY